jgi:NAD(P)-dependent dehydrogenase (short-subunit alcohol dehydrogenase family)
VLITGGASGIGEAHVEHFCAIGACLGFIDYELEASEALVARLADANDKPPVFIPANLEA